MKAKSGGLENDLPNYYDRKFDLSVTVGIGFILIQFLDLEIRYNHSLIAYHEFPLMDISGGII